MALTETFVDQHIARWKEQLTGAHYAHRKHWPSHLFHHAPLENAVAILRDGCLRSRNDPENKKVRDIAASGIIETRSDAHGYVRLYFRPKTPTQFHIEGIRKAHEYYKGNAHAPMLVMFLLDARAVLTQSEIQFSDKNMQLAGTNPGNDEHYFSQIPFSKVYSEGSTGGDRSFTDARCAEILTPSPLNLNGILKSICFRSEPEKETLLDMLGELRVEWESYCHVSDALKVFQKEYTFVDVLRLTSEGLIFRFNARKNGGSVNAEINIWDGNHNKILNFQDDALMPTPEAPYINWMLRHSFPQDMYLVEVMLEGQLAYRSNIVLGDTLF